MAKPNDVPTWATDDDFDAPGEDFDGTPTKVDPGGGQLQWSRRDVRRNGLTVTYKEDA